MASLKAISMRIKSVSNIGKITGAMKMTSTAKFKHEERRMKMGMPFALPAIKFFERLPEMDAASLPGLKIVVLASDKGMCGGVNSGLAKLTRFTTVEEEGKGTAVEILCCGSKSSSALKRLFGDRFKQSWEDIRAVPFSFGVAGILAEAAMNSDPQRILMIHNHFKSMIAYEPTPVPIYTRKAVRTLSPAEWSKAVDQYNFEPPTFEVWDDLQEWYTACSIYAGYLDGFVAEESARMAAMDNASKNSKEIVEKLTITYNRARQAKITTELCEIIAGASAQ